MASEQAENISKVENKTNLTYTIDNMNLSTTSIDTDGKRDEEQDWWNNLDEFVSDNESFMNDTLTTEQIEVIKQYASSQEKKKALNKKNTAKFLQSTLIQSKTRSIQEECRNEEQRQVNHKRKRPRTANRRIVQQKKVPVLSVLSKMISNQNQAADKLSASLMKIAEAQALTALAISDFTKVASKVMQIQKKKFFLNVDEHDIKKQKHILQVKQLQKQLLNGEKWIKNVKKWQ